jgi:hypothetical protein
VGQHWYQSTAIVLVLGLWTFLFYFKGTPSWILQKSFASTLAQIIGNVRKNCEALQIVY